ncbi:MAG: ABC transporter permease [Clostridium sp.]|nr:ABC transporter permease [Clostridium sp.]
MKLTTQLALSSLRENRKRTILTLLGIVLSVAMITAVFGFVAAGRNAMYRFLLAQGDYHVFYSGLTQEQAQTLAADPQFESSYTEITEDGSLILYCRLVKPSGNPSQQTQDIASNYNIVYFSSGVNTELLALEGHAPDRYSTVLFSIAAVLFLIIMGASVVVISNAFRVSAGERTKQFGMLKSVGATAGQIRHIVISEGYLLAILGIPLGIMVGLLVEAIGCALAGYFLASLNALNDLSLHVRFAAPWWVFLIATTLAFITIYISAYLPARKASKIPAIDAIRGKGEVKFKNRKVLTAKLTRKLFGVEGALASIAMKRSHRKYRATVIALSTSVILFLVGVSFGSALIVSSELIYPGLEATSVVRAFSYPAQFEDTEEWNQFYRLSPGTLRTLTKQFYAYDEKLSLRMIGTNLDYSSRTTDTDLWNENARKIAQQANETQSVVVQYYMLDDAFYEEIRKQAGAPEGSNILINQVITRIDGKQTMFTPYQNDVKELSITERRQDVITTDLISIGGTIENLSSELRTLANPQSGYSNTSTDSMTIFIITPNKMMNQVEWYIAVKDSVGFTTYAEDILENTVPMPEDDYLHLSAIDVNSTLAAQKGMTNLVLIFVYGFIAMLTLIGLTNVISTITTNIRLRKQEFAVLVSMGMTQSGLKRMINYESLLCGLRSLFYGLILGLALSRFLYNRLTDVVSFPYEFPLIPVIAAILAVLAITLVTQRSAAARVRRGNIIEAIRNNE